MRTETFERIDRRAWVRRDSGGSVHVVDRDDHSPVHHTYPTGYDPACSWCWLGYSHSERMHEVRVSQSKESK